MPGTKSDKEDTNIEGGGSLSPVGVASQGAAIHYGALRLVVLLASWIGIWLLMVGDLCLRLGLLRDGGWVQLGELQEGVLQDLLLALDLARRMGFAR